MIYALFNKFKDEYIGFFSSQQKALHYLDQFANKGMDGYSLFFGGDYKILEIKLDPEA